MEGYHSTIDRWRLFLLKCITQLYFFSDILFLLHQKFLVYICLLTSSKYIYIHICRTRCVARLGSSRRSVPQRGTGKKNEIKACIGRYRGGTRHEIPFTAFESVKKVGGRKRTCLIKTRYFSSNAALLVARLYGNFFPSFPLSFSNSWEKCGSSRFFKSPRSSRDLNRDTGSSGE